jgi:hypothetical protein
MKLSKSKNLKFMQKMFDLEELVTKEFIFDQNGSDKKSKTNSKINKGFIDDLMVEID